MEYYWRFSLALAAVLVAAIPHYTGGWFSLPLWVGLAITAGAVLPRWSLLVATPLPWLIGVGIGLLTGRYEFLGDFWGAAWALSTFVGAAGIAIGIGIARLIRRSTKASG